MSQLKAGKEAVRLEKLKKRAEKRLKEIEKRRKARESYRNSAKPLDLAQYQAILRDPDLSTVRSWKLIAAFKQLRLDLFKTLGTVESLESKVQWERLLTVLWLACPAGSRVSFSAHMMGEVQREEALTMADLVHPEPPPLAQEDENTVT
jgi:hypothetical protein